MQKLTDGESKNKANDFYSYLESRKKEHEKQKIIYRRFNKFLDEAKKEYYKEKRIVSSMVWESLVDDNEKNYCRCFDNFLVNLSQQYIDKIEFYRESHGISKDLLSIKREKQKKWRGALREEAKEYYKEYNKKWINKNRERYKIVIARTASRRRRELGFNLLSDNIIDEPSDYHHLNDSDVVAVPCDLHRLYVFHDNRMHRFMVNQIARQLYLSLSI